jgi:LacI family transcriptional regulator
MPNHLTLADIAKSAGVSISTASLALSGNPRVAEKTRLLLQEIAQRLNYQPNAMAQGLVSRRSSVIGLVIPGVRNPYFARVVESVELAVRAAGYRLVVATTGEDPKREKEALRSLIGHRVEGIIVTSCATSSAEFSAVFPNNFPVVLLGRRIAGLEADFLAIDHYAGTFSAISHLLTGGYRRIAMITGPMQLSDARSRLEGYRNALSTRRHPVDETLIVQGDFGEASGHRAMLELLDRQEPPDAVYVSNILMLQGALGLLRKRCVSIPQQLAVIANDRSDWLDLLPVPVSTVEQPTDSMGSIAAEMLLRRITDRSRKFEQIELKPSLVIRESSQPVSNNRSVDEAGSFTSV